MLPPCSKCHPLFLCQFHRFMNLQRYQLLPKTQCHFMGFHYLEKQLWFGKVYEYGPYQSHNNRHIIWEVANCPACRTYEIATRFWEVVICPIYMCLTVYEFSFILFDLCLFITIFNFILNYILIVTFWIFTYYKIWIMLINYYFIWNYWSFFIL